MIAEDSNPDVRGIAHSNLSHKKGLDNVQSFFNLNHYLLWN